MQVLVDMLKDFKLIYLVDISIVALVLYKLILMIRGTRAVQLIKGILVLVVATAITDWLELQLINWVLVQMRTVLIVALPIVFQPELRRALEQLGRGKLFARPVVILREEDIDKLISEIINAVQVLSKNKIGGLIVLEKESGLSEYMERGTIIDGLFSAELLVNLFIPKSPLHDGAVILRENRILSASTLLPLSDNPELSRTLGTRHRAGLGITEVSDAIAIIVSEETGFVSSAKEGKLNRYLDEASLKALLEDELKPKVHKPFWIWK